MSVPILQIATFTDDPFGGNPAYVVLFEENTPPAATLQRICHQLAQPLIAVLERSEATFHLRTVTPQGSHPGVGHATHAAAWVAFNRMLPSASEVDLALCDGTKRATRRKGEIITVDWPVMSFAEVDRRAELSDCLGRMPEATYEAAFGTVAVFATEEEIKTLKPDLAKVAGLDCHTVIVTAPGNSSDFVIRVFAPKEDLPEDPVCGTAHRILTPLWADRLKRRTLFSRQLSERRGELFCELLGDTVAVSGRAAVALDGFLSFEVDFGGQ